MMRGIDISNWQDGIIPHRLGVDFCICKATEGLGYVDPTCDGFVQDCIANGIQWGFYHFARENEPEAEAEYFYENCKNYFKHGIPVLDYETENYSNAEWCERFLHRLHELSGVWAIIYISAFRCAQYWNSWIPQKCGLWIAGYPYSQTDWADSYPPYDVGPWEFAALWQFTSSLNLNGWTLDGNLAYMDAAAWDKYAMCDGSAPDPDVPSPDNPSCERLADEVLAGKWGDGWNRQQALDAAFGPGTYEHVQQIVNRKLGA